MRLWHKDLIPYLPRQQLLGQWRECCCIAKNMYEQGTPNHILVNKILDYPDTHFNEYSYHIFAKARNRGYRCSWNNFAKWRLDCSNNVSISDIFSEWHNERYFWQCFYNLQEKYDCGGITDEEWGVIVDSVNVCIKER